MSMAIANSELILWENAIAVHLSLLNLHVLIDFLWLIFDKLILDKLMLTKLATIDNPLDTFLYP